MKDIPLEERVQARRSPIHGWGLFTLQNFAKNRALTSRSVRSLLWYALNIVYCLSWLAQT